MNVARPGMPARSSATIAVRRGVGLLGSLVLLAACGGTAAPPTSPPFSAGIAAGGSSAPPAATKPSSESSSAAAPAGSPGASGAAASVAKAAASGAEAPAAKPAASGATRMLVSYGASLSGQPPLWVAKDYGLFDKAGLDVDLKLINSTAATASLQSGETQVATVGGTETVNLSASGGDVVVIAVLSPVFPYKLEVVPSIKTPADLRGKKVSFGSGAGSVDTAMRLTLQSVGLNPDKDVQVIHDSGGGVPARLAAVQHGDVEATLISPPETLIAEKAGLHPLLDATKSGATANDALLVKREWLNANRPVAQRFINAVLQGVALFKSNRADAEAVLTKYQKLQGQENLDAAYDFFANEVIPAVPDPKPEQFTGIVQAASAVHPEVAKVDLAKILDPSLVRTAASAS